MSRLTDVLARYSELGIAQQLDYEKLYRYSIITHSTAIEGSTLTLEDNTVMFDDQYKKALQADVPWARESADDEAEIPQVSQATPQVDQVTPQVRKLLSHIGREDVSAAALMQAIGLSDRRNFRERYLRPALEAGLVEMTIPQNPRAATRDIV